MKTKTLKTIVKFLNSYVCDSKGTMPILADVKFDGYTIEASDLEMYSRFTVDTDSPFLPVCLQAKSLLSAIDESQVNVRNFEPLPNNEYQVFDCTLFGTSIEEFPYNPLYQDSSTKTITVSESFFTGIRAVMPAMSNDKARLSLNGIFLDVKRQKIVGCDGHRLITYDWEIDSNAFRSCIVPAKAVKALCELVKVMPICSDCACTLSKTNSELIISYQTTCKTFVSFYTRLLDGEYPDYTQIKPAYVDREYQIEDIRRFITAIKAVSEFCTDKLKTIKLKTAQGRTLLLTGESRDLGKSTREVKMSVHSTSVDAYLDDLDVGFSSKYLLEMLSKAKTVSLKFSSDLAPTIITTEDPKLDMILMPMRFE